MHVLSVRVQTSGIAETNVVRDYTPISVGLNSFTVPIKLYEDGTFTRHVEQWKVGDKIEWRGPYYTEDISLHKAPSVLMVCAGTGIAPFVRIIDELLDNDDCETFITLLYCVRTPEDMLLEEKLSQWSKYWNVKVVTIFSRSEENVQNHYIKSVTGRLDEDRLREYLTKTPQHTSSQIFVCGPKTFENDIAKYARRLGRENIKKFGGN